MFLRYLSVKMDTVTGETSYTNQTVSSSNSSVVTYLPNVIDDYSDEGIPDSTFTPKWTVHVFFAVLVCGVLVNAAAIFALLRCRRNGTLCLLLQMCSIDTVTTYVGAIEITTISEQRWLFSGVHCQIFKAIEMLTTVLLSYLLICINFHVISLWNLHKSDRSNKKNPLTSSIEESDECLVTKNENANRIINIDYRKRKNDVSIVIPSLTIWFLSLSLSLPTFAATSSLKLNSDGNVTCSIADFFHVRSLQILLVTFRLIVPTTLLIVTALLLLINICRMSKKDIDSIFMKRLGEIKVVLIFCLILTLLYMVTSLQRVFVQLYYMLSIKQATDTNDFISSFYDSVVSFEASVYLSMLHYLGPVYRGLLYLYIVPKNNLMANILPLCTRTDE